MSGRIVSSTIVKLGIKEFSIKTSAEVLVTFYSVYIMNSENLKTTKLNI